MPLAVFEDAASFDCTTVMVTLSVVGLGLAAIAVAEQLL